MKERIKSEVSELLENYMIKKAEELQLPSGDVC